MPNKHAARQTPLGPWFSRSRRTQSDVARELGITTAHMSNLVAGLRNPSADLLVALNRLIGLPPADLVMSRRTDEWIVEDERTKTPAFPRR